MRYAKRSSAEKRLLRCVAVGNMEREHALSVIRSDVEEGVRKGDLFDDNVVEGEDDEGGDNIMEQNNEMGCLDDRSSNGSASGPKVIDFSGNVGRLYDREMNDWVFYRDHGSISLKTRKLVRVS